MKKIDLQMKKMNPDEYMDMMFKTALSSGIIPENEIKKFITEITPEYDVVSPVNIREEHTLPDEKITYLEPHQSVKDIFLPQNETILCYKQDSRSEICHIEEPESGHNHKLLLGFPPCSAQALLVLDEILLKGSAKDPYYADKRKNSVLIPFACNTPLNQCFCTLTGGDPFNVKGIDAIIIRLDAEKSSIFMFTPIAVDLFNNIQINTQPPQDIINTIQELYRNSLSKLPEKNNLKNLNKIIKNKREWESVHEACVGCGICAFVCPTCHCFDFIDENLGKDGKKVRIWDTCQFSCYSREASGHNPRKNKSDRIRNRIMHKFNYIAERNGIVGCTGCGHCTVSCPTNMNMKEIVESIINNSDTGDN